MKVNEQECVKLSPLFRFQWEPAQNCHVLLYPEGMIKLNDSAGEILKHCTPDKSIAELIQELEQQFPSAEGLRNDVYDFLEVAHDNGWIQFSKLT